MSHAETKSTVAAVKAENKEDVSYIGQKHTYTRAPNRTYGHHPYGMELYTLLHYSTVVVDIGQDMCTVHYTD